MVRGKGQHRHTQSARPSSGAEARHAGGLSHRRWLNMALLGLVAITLALFVAVSARQGSWGHASPPGNPRPAAVAPPSRAAIEPRSLNELLSLPLEQLADVDLARMNLLCALGLPGAEDLDTPAPGTPAPGTTRINHALATLDTWAERVRFETERHLYRLADPRYAEHYRHSEAVLRAELLTQVLAEDLGVKYDMTAVGNFDFSNSAVAFIHGMIPAAGQTTADTPGGTCASMPVLVAAVGRRLGYPIRLVVTDSHIFCRWEGEDHPNDAFRGRFNMEVSGGFGIYEDAYYTTWPNRITEAQVRTNGYLLSLTPAEEFALFLGARGHCAMDNGQAAFAARCYENAYRYDPARPCYRSWFADAARRGGYTPETPSLAALLTHPMPPAPSARRVLDDALPLPSDLAAAAAGTNPLSADTTSVRAAEWQPPRPLIPGVSQPASPGTQPFNHNPQPDPFRSQP